MRNLPLAGRGPGGHAGGYSSHARDDWNSSRTSMQQLTRARSDASGDLTTTETFYNVRRDIPATRSIAEETLVEWSPPEAEPHPPRLQRRSQDAAAMLEDAFTSFGHLGPQSGLAVLGRRVRRPFTPTSEQRHPGKPGMNISRTTKPFHPEVRELEEPSPSCGSQISAAEKEENDFLSGWPLTLLVVGLCLAVFLISIDRTIITTAIPYITAEFHSTPDIGWYGSAYLLTACAFQPLFGRVFTLFSIKWSYLFSLLMFELGSLICALAPDSPALIAGRAVAGFGSAGILTGSFVIVANAVPLRLRPIYTAGTWRWCFYINLPVGGATVAAVFFFFHPRAHRHGRRRFVDRVCDLDLVGNAVLLGAAVMLFLALEYTTAGASWSGALVVGLLCGAGGAGAAFVAWQWWKQDGALIPPAIAMQRTVAASCAQAFTTYGALLILTYFLPLWFQAIQGASAIGSGVDMIPYFVVNAFFSLLAGVFVSTVGYFAAPAIVGSALGTAGCGALTLLAPGTTTAQWAGYEVLLAAGFGLAIQQGFTAVQTVLPEQDVAIGTAAVVASQSLGGAVFLSVGNSVFQNRLMAASRRGGGAALRGVDIQKVINAGAASFRHVVPAEQLPALLEAYNRALQITLAVAVPLGGLAFVACCFMEWKSVKGVKGK